MGRLVRNESGGMIHVAGKIVAASVGLAQVAYEIDRVEVCGFGEHSCILFVGLVDLMAFEDLWG